MCCRCFHQICLVKPFKDKKGKIVLQVFIEIVNESKCKSKTSCVDQGKKL